jgi:hypothetical protein
MTAKFYLLSKKYKPISFYDGNKRKPAFKYLEDGFWGGEFRG